ncbi:unnamed protein product [Calicophoron daubneyi]|uniref:Mediator complex subunit Med12 domain-containing protein n=1 Tax=Calicophoron daubneyi TaxID=300641 RepID=A0AAV2TRC9_CALDB
MSSFPSLENRSLKRKKHCPPDVYQQRDEQKEDLMSEDFVRDGYRYTKPVRDEYESCKEESKFVNLDSLWRFFHGVVVHKYECSNFQDLRRKPTTSVRDTMLPAIDMYKGQVSDWFKELAGAAPLQSLRKRMPYYKDKEEIVNELLANEVPISRAIWFINMSVIQTTALAENAKKKQRTPFDPTGEWTNTICRMLTRMLEQSCSEPQNPGLEADWEYLFTLLLAMYDKDMADHWEVLLWMVKRAEFLSSQSESKSPASSSAPPGLLDADQTLKFFLHYLLIFGCRFTENELITRRLLFWCSSVFSTVAFGNARVQPSEGRSEIQSIFDEYHEACACPFHRSVLMSLSSLMISLTLSCPSAAVWNYIPLETDHVYLKGSPLDLIPYSLTTLPMPPGPETNSIRKCLSEVEEVIITRGRLAENGWNRQATTETDGEAVERLVKVLDILDRQDYYVVREPNPMEVLFNRIFNDDSIHLDTAAIVTTLCEWAVSVHRVGIYRSVVVACLIEHLVSTFQSNQAAMSMLQETLVNFLDELASNLPPFTSDQAPVDNEPMRSLVCLFAELIDRELFSHDAYVRHFIARGAFSTSYHPLAVTSSQSGQTLGPMSMGTPNQQIRVQNALSSQNVSNNVTAQCSVASEVSEDNDRCSMDNPDSVRSECGLNVSSGHFTTHPQPACALQAAESDELSGSNAINRSGHLHFLAQFPIPQDESYLHEQNQRFQILYGSARARDRARYGIRQLVRDIGKLFTKKVYLIDVIHGEMCRRKKSKDREKDKDGTSNGGSTGSSGHKSSDDAHSIDKLHEDIMTRFLNLSFHDMECVISQCTPTYIKMLSGSNVSATSGSSGEDHLGANNPIGSANPSSPPTSNATNTALAAQPPGSQPHILMPVPSSIFLFFELIETSLNITSLISTIVDTLERLQILFENRTLFMTLYMSFLCLRAVGILQRHQPVLLTMGDLPNRLFPTLIEQVRQVKEPAQCGPFERCILAYLNDLFTSSFAVKTRFNGIYGKAHHKVSALFRSVDAPKVTANYDPEYADELLKAGSFDNLSIFRAYAEDLRNNPNARFSFVCRAITFVCQANTSERLYYLCWLCAELTSQCGELTPEWLGSLYAVLAPRPYLQGYAPLVNAVEPGDVNMYDNLSSLVGTLLSRYCFTISDFLRWVICPAMAHGLDRVPQPVGPQLEPIIRLACHILHRLFTAESTVSSLQTTSNVLTPNHDVAASCTTGNPNSDAFVVMPPFRISEPLLLTGALQKVTSEFLVDVLKMLIIQNDKASTEVGSKGEVSSENAEDGNSSGDDSQDDGDGTQDDVSDSDDDEEMHDDVVDSGSRRKRSKQGHHGSNTRRRKRRRTHARRSPSSVDKVHPTVQRFLESKTLPTVAELRALPLGALIQLVLREICTVSWVRERFSRMSPDQLIRENVLIDKNFSHSQARRLLHIIYCPYDIGWCDVGSTPEGLAGAMCHVLRNLNLWTLRCAQMKFQLLYAQIPFSQQPEVLGYVAQSIVAGFQTQALNWLNASGSGLSADGSMRPIGGLPSFEIEENDPVWLLPALIAKLPKSVKAQIVKATSETLKGIKLFWKHKNDEDKESVLLQNSIILAHPAFFSLLKICLQEADLMDALYEQIDYFVENAKETEDRVPDNLRTRQVVQECLRLRLTLVGHRFRTMQIDPEACSRWALLLTQLISHGVIEPESNSTLFYTVLDMLQTLVHTLAARTGLEGKPYQTLVKKLRQKLVERPLTSGTEQVRPLLIPSKSCYTIFVTGRTRLKPGGSGSSGGSMGGGSGTGGSAGKASGGGKTGGSKSVSKASGLLSAGGGFTSGSGRSQAKKRGYMIIGKERMAPWDAQDPSKQATLLSMYGAVRTEAIPSRAEEQANRLIRHDHFIRLHRSPDFYVTPVYAEQEEIKSQSVDANVVDNDRRSSSSRSVKSEPVVSVFVEPTTTSTKNVMLPPSSGPVTCTPCPSGFDPSGSNSDGSHKFLPSGSGNSKLQTATFGGSITDINVSERSDVIDETTRTMMTHQHSSVLECGMNFTPEDNPAMSINVVAHQLQQEYPRGFVPENVSRQVDNGASICDTQSQGLKASYSQQSNRSSGSLQHFSEIPGRTDQGIVVKGNQRGVIERGFQDLVYSTSSEMGSGKTMRVSNRFTEQRVTSANEVVNPNNLTATTTTVKRKRGSGRRGASSNMAAGNSRVNPNAVSGTRTSLHPSGSADQRMLPNQISDQSSADVCSDITVSGANALWASKQNAYEQSLNEQQQQQHTRPPAHLANLSGFLRSRAQQQAAAAAAAAAAGSGASVSSTSVSHQQNLQSYNSFSQSGSVQQPHRLPHQRDNLATGAGYGQTLGPHGDMGSEMTYSTAPNISFGSGGGSVTEVNASNLFASPGQLGSHTGEINPQAVRQVSGGVNTQRYAPQFIQQRSHVGMSQNVSHSVTGHMCQIQQQSVPHPPPYPMSQQQQSQQQQLQPQQHLFSRNQDDNYVFMLSDGHNPEEGFSRIATHSSVNMGNVNHPNIHRQAGYQQQHTGEQLNAPMMHQSQVCQVPGAQVHRTESGVIHSQQQQQQQNTSGQPQYPRFTTY